MNKLLIYLLAFLALVTTVFALQPTVTPATTAVVDFVCGTGQNITAKFPAGGMDDVNNCSFFYNGTLIATVANTSGNQSVFNTTWDTSSLATTSRLTYNLSVRCRNFTGAGGGTGEDWNDSNIIIDNDPPTITWTNPIPADTYKLFKKDDISVSFTTDQIGVNGILYFNELGLTMNQTANTTWSYPLDDTVRGKVFDYYITIVDNISATHGSTACENKYSSEKRQIKVSSTGGAVAAIQETKEPVGIPTYVAIVVIIGGAWYFWFRKK